MAQAAEQSSWENGVIGDMYESFYHYRRAYNTAPEYETPIISQETKYHLQLDYVSAFKHSFQNEYKVNEDITLITRSEDGEENLIVELCIDDFEKWASSSRLIHDPSNGDQILGLGGKYYVDLEDEIIDTVKDHPLPSFESVELKEKYRLNIPISVKKLEKMCDEF